MKQQIEKSVTKLEFLSNVIANSDKGAIDLEGLYFVFSDVIEEIKAALEDVQDRPAYTAANHAA
jgi:hypothetical protein